MSAPGTIYLTDNRITFIGTTEIEEWNYEHLGSPNIQTASRIVTFPLTNRKKVTGVIILDDDWSKFIFFMNAAVGTAKIGTSALQSFQSLLTEYQKAKPVTS